MRSAQEDTGTSSTGQDHAPFIICITANNSAVANKIDRDGEGAGEVEELRCCPAEPLSVMIGVT